MRLAEIHCNTSEDQTPNAVFKDMEFVPALGSELGGRSSLGE